MYQNSDVWINGTHLGFHPFGYTPFTFDITPYLSETSANVIAVRVDNSGLTSRWYSGSGIYRHTWVTVTGAVRVPAWACRSPPRSCGRCVHDTHGPLGAVAVDRTEERRVELLLAAGFTAIRTAHNPPAPSLLDACDRLGMLVMDEFTDCWDTGKNPRDYHVHFPQCWQQDLSTMIQRDRNHPSVVIWSIGNEIVEDSLYPTPRRPAHSARALAGPDAPGHAGRRILYWGE